MVWDDFWKENTLWYEEEIGENGLWKHGLRKEKSKSEILLFYVEFLDSGLRVHELQKVQMMIVEDLTVGIL